MVGFAVFTKIILFSDPSILGEIYEKGLGVPKDMKRSFSYFWKAAVQGNEYARNHIESVDEFWSYCNKPTLKQLAAQGSSKAYLKLFEIATEIGWGDEYFSIRSIGGDTAVRDWIDKQLAPYANSVDDVVRGAYANMLMFDAEGYSSKQSRSAIDQFQRAFQISEELYRSGNPHITVGAYYFHPNHVARRTAFRLADRYYSLADYKNSEKYSYCALDKKYMSSNCDSLLEGALDRVSWTIRSLYDSGNHKKAMDILHQFFKVLYEYETYDEVAPVDEILKEFIDKL